MQDSSSVNYNGFTSNFQKYDKGYKKGKVTSKRVISREFSEYQDSSINLNYIRAGIFDENTFNTLDMKPV